MVAEVAAAVAAEVAAGEAAEVSAGEAAEVAAGEAAEVAAAAEVTSRAAEVAARELGGFNGERQAPGTITHTIHYSRETISIAHAFCWDISA